MKTIISILTILCLQTGLAYGAASTYHKTYNDTTGEWSDAGIWENADGNLTNNDSVHIYGYIERNSNLVLINNIIIRVFDTLIIYGDLTIENNGHFFVESGGIVIVYGNVTAENNVNVDLESYFVCFGDFTHNNNSELNAPDNDTLLYVTGESTCNMATCLDDSLVGGEDDLLDNPDLADLILQTSVFILPSNPNICSGSNVELYIRDDATNYQWYRNEVAIGGATNATYTATLAGRYDVSFDLDATPYPRIGKPDSVTVIVNILTPTLSSSDADNIICAGDQVTFTAGGGTNYEFKLNGTTDQDGASNTYVTTSLADGDAVKVIVTNASGCTDSTAAITTTVNIIPVITSNTDNDRCGTGTVILEATADAGTIDWYANATGGVSLNSGDVFTTPVISVTTSYYVDATIGSCITASRTKVTATINPIPVTSDINGSATPLCNANGIIYSVDPSPASKFNWTVLPDATIVTDTTGIGVNSIEVNFGSNDENISVFEVSEFGCVGTTKTLAITLGCVLDANFVADKTEVCKEDMIVFTNTSLGTTPAAAYSWNFGEGATPASATGIGTHSVSYSTSGSKTIELIVNDGGADTETKTNYIAVQEVPLVEVFDTSRCGSGEVLFRSSATDVSSVDFSFDNGMSVNQTVAIAPYTASTTILAGESAIIVARAINSLGCIGDWGLEATGVSYENPETGSINDGADFGGYVDVACRSEQKTYSVNLVDGSSYLWEVSDLDISTETLNEIDIVWDIEDGAYIIAVTEISEKGCIGEASSGIVRVHDIQVSIGEDIELCEGENSIIDINDIYESYEWHDGSTGTEYIAEKEEKIRVTVTDNYGCSVSDSLQVVVHENPEVQLGNDTVICGDDYYELFTGDYFNYDWSTGEVGSSVTIYSGEKTVSLTVANEYGCTGSDTIQFFECSELVLGEITNAFTPNGDNKHDTWIINDIELFPNSKIEVFDRWGKRVFIKDGGYNVDNAWDGTYKGKKLPIENYFYTIDLYGDGKKILSGTLTIVK